LETRDRVRNTRREQRFWHYELGSKYICLSFLVALVSIPGQKLFVAALGRLARIVFERLGQTGDTDEHGGPLKRAVRIQGTKVADDFKKRNEARFSKEGING
ncbi:MAG TPA: hypothetical protein VN833_14180, partial [Candidatus Acidoferrales bacterium]|nr:hypothetical protein [Candidatus Acidoferrales bacterium]